MPTQKSKASSLDCTVTVAGCGDMGAPILSTLLAAGIKANGYDPRPPDNPALLPHMLTDPAAIGHSDILMVVVRDSTQIEQLCFDDQAVYRGNRGPGLLIVSSTVSPHSISQLRRRLPKAVRLVDAPMSGAPHAAEQASLSYMLGGDTADIDHLMPLFERLGQDITHVGALGTGMMAKVLNNYVAACSVVAVRRSLARASRSGLSTSTLRKIMSASSGATWYGNHLDDISWAQQNYNAGNTIGIIEKDVKCALDAIDQQADPFDEALLQALRELPDYPAGD